ncbi:MAG: exosortase system-associated protein, TIGR04073 family [Omnitrophica bacterium]|nr:exosortase system-associated protein, TIGR04073 family [Candidatus Omnitrophota bacterium]
MIKVVTITIVALFLVVAFTSVSFAAEARPINKLGNGLNNLLTSWMDIPRQVKAVSEEQDAFAGMTYGVVKGIGLALARTIAGTFDVITFPFEPYDQPAMDPIYGMGD